MDVPFTKPMTTPLEISLIEEVLSTRKSWGGGRFTQLSQEFLASSFGSKASILTTSATDALEMSAVLLDIKPGDEVIVPSYTFVSTANAFVSRGAIPVFVDVHRANQLINPSLVEAAITDRTVAILPVHYAGNSCDMPKLSSIAENFDLKVVEDAAQAIGARKDGVQVGSQGDLSCISFHGTKNVVSGEGGALMIRDDNLVERAHHVSEKGTNRRDFINGRIDKYTWVDLGSSFIPSEILAAYLWAQLQCLDEITKRRVETWTQYQEGLNSERELMDSMGIFIPEETSLNGHLFPIIFKNRTDRDAFIEGMREKSIEAVTHYTALHSSAGGRKYGRLGSTMENTDWVTSGLVRLPIWSQEGLPTERILEVAKSVIAQMKMKPQA
jgi:dTDP-4-amino-4,6-dideoxygalactose transaminase